MMNTGLGVSSVWIRNPDGFCLQAKEKHSYVRIVLLLQHCGIPGLLLVPARGGYKPGERGGGERFLPEKSKHMLAGFLNCNKNVTKEINLEEVFS